jgi:CHAT domain-containing protein
VGILLDNGLPGNPKFNCVETATLFKVAVLLCYLPICFIRIIALILAGLEGLAPQATEQTTHIMRLFALLLLLLYTESISAQTTDFPVNVIWTTSSSLDSSDQVFSNQAQALLSQGDAEGALAQYQLWINQLLPEFNNEDPAANPSESDLYYSTPSLVSALLGKAKLLEQQANPKDRSGLALEPALTCRELIVDALFHLRQNEHGAALSYEKLQAHRQQEWEAINLAYLLYEKSNNPSYLLRCFRLVEKSKKAALVNTLVHPKSHQLANVPPDLLAQLANEKTAIGRLHTKWANEMLVANNSITTTVKEAKENYINARKAYNRKLSEFSKLYPQVYGLRHNESIVTVGEIQKRLQSKEQVLLSYYQTADNLYGFVFTLNGMKAKRLELPSELNQQIGRFHAMLKNKEDLQNCAAYNELAFKLYETLIKPFEPLAKEVVIIPDGLIGFIAFNALLYQSAGNSCAFEEHPFLLHKYQINLHYSAEAFAKDAYADKKKTNNRFDVLAPPDHVYAKKLQKQAGGHFIPAENLSPDLVLSSIPSASLVLIANELICKSDAEGTLGSLLWEERKQKDIAGANVATQLVTLSNCDVRMTSEVAPQEGNIPILIRSLFHHGADCVLSTLWPIPDQNNEKILGAFFHALKNGKNKSDSFQISNQSFLTATPGGAAPSQWASYVLIGNTNAIAEKNWYWLLLLILPIGLLWYLWRKKRRERIKKEREVTTTMEY